ncbi:protein phosphatase 1 regulatory subunit 42-like [Periplaneta americana]|uniref:protein phosphatase 1 regulatory subunit 42-like n=1 Tax=Periplaneta americana TaxID=6978 RepID=UPI0037E8D1B7
MVKLTAALVIRKMVKKSNQQNGNEKAALRKLTHLHLKDNFIDSIGNITECKNLTVIYLQNNYLTKIENLEHASNLTHLYLQRNNIKKIENLSGLTKLKKLYIGQNCIAVIEGLDKLCNLEELHIQKQQLPQGEMLHFDPRTMKGLSRCLHVLDITSNGLSSIADLECLQEIEWLIARSNKLSDITDLTQTISQWYNLTTLELQGNPVCSQQKYRERLITSSNRLVLLDGKQIHETTRDFLKKLEMTKIGRQMAPQLLNSTPTLSADITNLTKNFTPGVRKSITQSILQDAELTTVMNENLKKTSNTSMFPAWKMCLESDSCPIPKQLVPRPFWRQVKGGRAPCTQTKKSKQNLTLPFI